jgi:hypothetical protein
MFALQRSFSELIKMQPRENVAKLFGNNTEDETYLIINEITKFCVCEKKAYSNTFILVRGLRESSANSHKLITLIHRLIFLGFNLAIDSLESERQWVLDHCGIEINCKDISIFDIIILADSHIDNDDTGIDLHMMGREICHFSL